MKHWLAILSITVLVSGTAALGRPARALAQEEISCEGPLQGDEYRYGRANVAVRTGIDLAAVPASIVGWDQGDYMRLTAFAVPTVGLMLPANPSLDVRVQNWIKHHEKPALDRLFVKVQSVPEALTLAGYGVALFSTAYFRKDEKLREFATLSLESLGVTQFYHILLKLLIGRESPYQGSHNGEIYGPTKLDFPGGTPSGHAATAYALLGMIAMYYDKWPLYLLAHVAGLYISASLLYERQHFLSDIIFGAGMGWYISKWINRHRSSKYRCKRNFAWYEKVLWMPVVTGGGRAYGLGASYRF